MSCWDASEVKAGALITVAVFMFMDGCDPADSQGQHERLRCLQALQVPQKALWF
jgi:hypothetical protein